MNKLIFDYHVHMGQFNEIYYNPYKVVDVLSFCGVKGAYVSSTTACMEWNTSADKEIIINHIIDEVLELRSQSSEIGFDARPLCWINPRRYIEGEPIRKIYGECSYCGFKIHPRAHEWNLNNRIIQEMMDHICETSAKHRVPILIHTGLCSFEKPSKFENWFSKFPNVKFILAHCKDPEEMLLLYQKYNNVFGDTSMCSEVSVHMMCKNGFSDRIIFGTDFPATAYLEGIKSTDENVLLEHYHALLQYQANLRVGIVKF